MLCQVSPFGNLPVSYTHLVYEQTLCTSVMCAESGIYYFSPAWNRRISAVRPKDGMEYTVCFDLGTCQDVDYLN